MLFNSPAFLFFFLPLVLTVFFVLGHHGRHRAALACLVVASLIFYGWLQPKFAVWLVATMLVNYTIGNWLARPQTTSPRRYLVLCLGVALNILALGIFKYTGFVVRSAADLAGTPVPSFVEHIVLPLGISFCTFQQIAYLVDAYHRSTPRTDFLRYSLFISFFPHSIAGPIIHHQTVLPQFADPETSRVKPEALAAGLFLFTIGLVKKVVIADTFSGWVSQGYDAASALTLIEAWTTSLAYTVQLYFDFSGYSDMAVGLALMFNIRLPFNFNSPYRATSITEFWRRWHISLSQFLRDYLYVPLGGNRTGAARTYLNLFLVFLIGGIWHGAGWTFIIWGMLHGLGMIAHRAWTRHGRPLPALPAWLLTVLFVNVTWVFFRAPDVATALDVLGAMAGTHGIDLALYQGFPGLPVLVAAILLGGAIWLTLLPRNSITLLDAFVPGRTTAILTAIAWLMIFVNMGRTSEFIYFQF